MHEGQEPAAGPGYDFDPAGKFEGLEGGREGGAGGPGGTTRNVAATTPAEGYGREFVGVVERELGERGTRDGRSSLPPLP